MMRLGRTCSQFRAVLRDNDDLWRTNDYEKLYQEQSWKELSRRVALIEKVSVEQERTDNIFFTELSTASLRQIVSNVVDSTVGHLCHEALFALFELTQGNVLHFLDGMFHMHAVLKQERGPFSPFSLASMHEDLVKFLFNNKLYLVQHQAVHLQDQATTMIENNMPRLQIARIVRRLAYRAGILEVDDSSVLGRIWALVHAFLFQLLAPISTSMTYIQGQGSTAITKEMLQESARKNEFAVHAVYLHDMQEDKDMEYKEEDDSVSSADSDYDMLCLCDQFQDMDCADDASQQEQEQTNSSETDVILHVLHADRLDAPPKVFRINKSAMLVDMMTAYARWKRVDLSTLRFALDGEELLPHQTLSNLALCGMAPIDVVVWSTNKILLSVLWGENRIDIKMGRNTKMRKLMRHFAMHFLGVEEFGNLRFTRYFPFPNQEVIHPDDTPNTLGLQNNTIILVMRL